MAAERPVTPLEHVAPIYIEVSEGYVDVKQARGDHTLYTPKEAEELAHDLVAAAEAARES